MNLRRLLYVPIVLLFVLSVNVFADATQILIVTNNKDISNLSKKQIKQIYLEGDIKIPLKPINLKYGNKFRSIFNTKIIGLTESRIKAYWAQMKFTGRASPPLEVSNIDELVSFLDNNPDYIAYVPLQSEIPASLNVVYSLNY